jgi:hypothetical protein
MQHLHIEVMVLEVQQKAKQTNYKLNAPLWDASNDITSMGCMTKNKQNSWTKVDVMAENISRALKSAATELQYPTNKGIPISRINTPSLRSGGANALALVGYPDKQIRKMGQWCGATSKEYIREELACYTRGML